MIRWVEAYAQNRWLEWTGRKPRGLRSAMLTASRHGHQRCTLLIADGLRPPQVAVKVGWSELSRRGIDEEYRTLMVARSALPAAYATMLPTSLDLVATPNAVVLFTAVVRGRRPAVPNLLGPADRFGKSAVDQYLAMTMGWSVGLSRATSVVGLSKQDPIADYRARFPDNAQPSHLMGHLPVERAWQHGDPAAGNVLIHGQRVGLVDWEHASAESLPWHDLAYIVPVMALIAARQSAIHPTVAFDALYRPSSWCGDLIRGRLTEAWSHSTDIAAAVAISAMQLAVDRGHTNAAWLDLAHHLLSMKGPAWLQT